MRPDIERVVNIDLDILQDFAQLVQDRTAFGERYEAVDFADEFANNLRGELVGINSAIFTPSGGNVGIGFAIPSAMAWHVMEQLAEYGEVRRGTLGIFVQDLTTDLAGAFGVYA